jgi:Glycosyltransferase sugar-binding region containing DXD motif
MSHQVKAILYTIILMLLLIASCRQGLRVSSNYMVSIKDSSRRSLEAPETSSLLFIYQYLSGTIQRQDGFSHIKSHSTHNNHHNKSRLAPSRNQETAIPLLLDDAIDEMNTNSSSSIDLKNDYTSSVRILPSNYTPSSPCVFLIWTGSSTLPPMYALGLQSAIRAFGGENIVIVSPDLLVASMDWYPTTTTTTTIRIWNISSHALAARVTDIHPLRVWERFFRRIQHPAHFADFQRIALLYLYGGLYTDIDALWLRAPPFIFPVPAAGGRGRKNGKKQQWQGKSLLLVVDRDRRQRAGIPSNGVIGGVKNATYFRHILHLMPLKYKSRKWTGIGGSLLKTSYDMMCNGTNAQNCSDDFIEISRPNMYGCMYETAKEMDIYNRALSDDSPRDQDLKKHVLSDAFQLHIYGSSIVSKGNITSSPVQSKVHPVSGSLYDVVLKQLNLTLPT